MSFLRYFRLTARSRRTFVFTLPENVDVYSTDETETFSQWIDGKPIYRKVIPIPAGPNVVPTTYPLNIASFGQLISLRGAMQSSGGDFFPLPYVEESMIGDPAFPDAISAKLIAAIPPSPPDSLQLTPVAGSDYSHFSGYVVIEYTKA